MNFTTHILNADDKQKFYNRILHSRERPIVPEVTDLRKFRAEYENALDNSFSWGNCDEKKIKITKIDDQENRVGTQGLKSLYASLLSDEEINATETTGETKLVHALSNAQKRHNRIQDHAIKKFHQVDKSQPTYDPYADFEITLQNNKITNSLLTATNKICNKKVFSFKPAPWEDEELNELIENYCKRPDIRNKLLIVNKQNELFKDFYVNQALKINAANQERNPKEEYFLANTSKLLSNNKQILIDPKALADFYETHFSENYRPVPEELIYPDKFPYLEEAVEQFRKVETYDGPPTKQEIKEILWALPNHRCVGTDQLYLESFKYGVNSEAFVGSLRGAP